MDRIVGVNVEHNGQSWFGTEISGSLTAPHALQQALLVAYHEAMSSPGRVTRIEFTYEGDDDA